MIKTKSLSIIQASNRGCSPWAHRPVLLGRQVGELWTLTFSSYPHSFPRSHPHLCSWAPAAVSPHTHLTSPPVHHTVLKTSLLPFILAPNSSKWSPGTHRPLMPVKRTGQLQIFISCSYPLNRIAQPHPWFFIRPLLPLFTLSPNPQGIRNSCWRISFPPPVIISSGLPSPYPLISLSSQDIENILLGTSSSHT